MTLVLTSCFSNEYELIGKKKVEGSSNLYVEIYQKDEFDHVTPVDYTLLNEKGSTIIPMKFLTGTDVSVSIQKIENFDPFLHDSIFYLCYPYPEVYAIHHLHPSKSQLHRDSLFQQLKEYDSKLIDKRK